MTKQEAFKCLFNETECSHGHIDDIPVNVWPADIRYNIESNGDLDLDWSQDFNHAKTADIVQGYSLADIELDD